MVLVLDQAPDGFAGVDPAEVLGRHEILADLTDPAGRHLVVTGESGRHRLLVKAPHCQTGHAFVIVPDQWRDARARAVSAYFGTLVPSSRSDRWPTRFQRYRLGQMLATLDLLECVGGRPVTLRELAATVIYPRVDLGRAIEWKTSSRRRQTQRLLGEARAMTGGGYRRLLLGAL
ncbi:DUF2285 domain-containing protein [Novosphingobium sp.]|uniref:DUF2285 domain-containing protein n=1 Tax=Novosphingobium sp. TaxID=1874826 RepID=UPI00273331CA|nr:DUF2285 domain-containing protein [Novosphingobium sp.]MDP3906741.1 DUF2285 domain-containing protein [Novosphingobium sp.]